MKELNTIVDISKQRRIDPKSIHVFSEKDWRTLLSKRHAAIERRLDLWLRQQAAKECES